MLAGLEGFRQLGGRTGGHALGAANPAGEVRALLDPLLQQRDLLLGQIIALGRHVAVVVLRQHDRFVDGTLVRCAGSKNRSVLAAFDDGPGGVEAETGLGLLLLAVLLIRSLMAVDAFLGEEREQVFFKTHRSVGGGGAEAGDDKKRRTAHRGGHGVGRGDKRKTRRGASPAKIAQG